LEHRSRESVNILTKEIRRLDSLEAQLEVATVRAEREDFELLIGRQRQVIPQVVEALRHGEIGPVRDFPFYIPPYHNAFQIPVFEGVGRSRRSVSRASRKVKQHRVFISVDGPEMVSRLTDLGMYLNVFRPGRNIHIEIDATGFEGPEGTARRDEIKLTAQTIVSAFSRARPESQFTIKINRDEISGEVSDLPEVNRDAYFNQLEPLSELIEASTGIPAAPPKIHVQGAIHSNILRNLIEENIGATFLLGYYGGPINRGIKSALTRPERKTLLGIYQGSELIEAISLYQHPSGEARILSHRLLSEFEVAFPERYGKVHSEVYFEGIPVAQFISDWNLYAEGKNLPLLEPQGLRQGREELELPPGEIHDGLRVLGLRSTPIEEAMVQLRDEQGNNLFLGINPAVLRTFLNDNSSKVLESRERMLQELTPLYEHPLEANLAVPMEGGVPPLLEILQRYLTPYFEARTALFEQHPVSRAFIDYPDTAFGRLIMRRNKRTLRKPDDS